MKRFSSLSALLIAASLALAPSLHAQKGWTADNGDGTFTNPLLWGDWPDPDVIRVDDTYYMVSTSMHYVPGVPVLSSRDLVHWKPESYAVARYDEDPRYDMQGGTLYLNGAWASSIRHHNGKFYVAFCTPYGWGTKDGHFSICEADSPKGPWKRTIFPEYLYDPGLFIDDDGRGYVVHGQGTLRVTPLSADLHSVAGPAVEIWKQRFGADRQAGTGGYGMEGSHVYKINGYYYILCPAGGTQGWQICLRSRSIYGPYEHRVVLDDDRSYVGNGLHQGGMVQTSKGDWWFIIMQDRGPIGRVPCLLPVTWQDGWPIIGAGGKDAVVYPFPTTSRRARRDDYVPADDDFSSHRLGLQWQWNHNPSDAHWSLTERPGFMRLKALPAPDLYHARNTLTQRVQGPLSIATVEMDMEGLTEGTVAGFGIFEKPYACLAVRQGREGRTLVMQQEQTVADSVVLAPDVKRLWLRAYATEHQGTATFMYSLDGRHFTPLGPVFHMRLGFPWTANRFALFCYDSLNSTPKGYADFDNFRLVTK